MVSKWALFEYKEAKRKKIYEDDPLADFADWKECCLDVIEKMSAQPYSKQFRDVLTESDIGPEQFALYT